MVSSALVLQTMPLPVWAPGVSILEILMAPETEHTSGWSGSWIIFWQKNPPAPGRPGRRMKTRSSPVLPRAPRSGFGLEYPTREGTREASSTGWRFPIPTRHPVTTQEPPGPESIPAPTGIWSARRTSPTVIPPQILQV